MKIELFPLDSVAEPRHCFTSMQQDKDSAFVTF